MWVFAGRKYIGLKHLGQRRAATSAHFEDTAKRKLRRSLEIEGRLKMNSISQFWYDEQGQDLIEYTLLMAFVALASAALFLGAGGSLKGIWSVTNNQLAQANSKAS